MVSTGRKKVPLPKTDEGITPPEGTNQVQYCTQSPTETANRKLTGAPKPTEAVKARSTSSFRNARGVEGPRDMLQDNLTEPVKEIGFAHTAKTVSKTPEILTWKRCLCLEHPSARCH